MAKKPATQDWHKADITAAIHKAGLTFRGLARDNGYKSHDACSQALHRPYPKAQRIIADALGLSPEQIWPSRYPFKTTTAAGLGNVKAGREH